MKLTDTQHLRVERDYWRELAETDQLTGLFNRFAFERRTHAREGWFVVCDLNNFKRAQDMHPSGHVYGDEVLRDFAMFLDSSTRDSDRVAARIGGDEFVIWCPTESGARAITERVRNWTRSLVTAAAGMGKTLAAADAAMYNNKRTR